MHNYYNVQRPTRGRAPKPQKGGMGGGAKALVALALVLVFLVSGALTFWLLGGFSRFGGSGPTGPIFGNAKQPAAGYVAQGTLRAMRLAPPAAESDEAAMRSYFEDAAAYAKANGINTILFTARTGLAVWWRDDVFPSPAGVEAQGKLDPLALLCQALDGQEIQLWAEVAPYAAGNVDENSRAKAAKHVQNRGGAITADDSEYTAMLVESLRDLAYEYPISGIIFSGFESSGESEAANTAFAQSFGGALQQLHSTLESSSRSLPLGIAFTAGASRLGEAQLAVLAGEGALTWLLPTLAAGQAGADALSGWAYPGISLLAVQPAQADNGLFLYSASQHSSCAGGLVASYPASSQQTAALPLLLSALNTTDAPAPTGLDIPKTLAVTYPDQNTTTTDAGLFIMGVSDPAQPLYMDGEELASRAEGGAFGVGVELELGQNSFTFTQGESSYTLTVTRRQSGGTGGTGSGTLPEGDVPEAQKGQAVRVTSVIASVLIDPHNDLSPSLNETLHQGAVFVVEESVRTTRWNADKGRTERIWAYKMKSGEYVLGTNCEFVDSGAAGFTGITATADDGGEWLDFTGSGTPAAYVQFENETGRLSLTFYDTAFTLAGSFQSQYVTAAAVTTAEDGATVLSLDTNGIWGYSLEYDPGANTTRLYLKKPPSRSADPARPLAGVRIMIDAGHGGSDIGALGVMGTTGPNEKQMNLAQAQAIAWRLQQMGAEVIMTRSSDEYVSLQQRLAAQTEHKPDFFLSVHHNSVTMDQDRNEVQGLEVYYYHPYDTPQSRQFAQSLLDAVAAGTGRTARKDGVAGWGAYYVTRTTVCPSVLFEFGFVMNPAEFEDITSAAGMYAAAFAVGEAVLNSIPG